MTGTGHAAIARARASSLNAQRSSADPPPRPMITTSISGTRAMALSAATKSRAASSPCTRAARTTMRAAGWRVVRMRRMSRNAAPSSDVTTPMRRGSTGSGRLRAASNRPSAWSVRFNCSNAAWSAPRPCGSSASHDELILALDLVHAQSAAGDDVHAVLGSELQLAGRRPEHDRAELREVVLQREVQMAGTPVAAVRDLALDVHGAERALDQGLEAGRDLTHRQRARRRRGVIKRQVQPVGHRVSVARPVGRRAPRSPRLTGSADRWPPRGRSPRRP